MGRHATTFEKECLCFRCPLEDCRSPCPFGMDRKHENMDEYLEIPEYMQKPVDEKERMKKEKLKEYHVSYYLKKKEKLKEYQASYYRKNKERLAEYKRSKYRKNGT